MLNRYEIDNIVMIALKEDIALGDITTDSIISRDSVSNALIISKDDGIIAGLDVAERTFLLLDDKITFCRKVKEGEFVKKGDIIAEVTGGTATLLMAERTALNFMQRMSGIATKTRKFCDALQNLKTKIVDTRKTTPGLRVIEKYAVKVGGGYNHRFCLSDGVLIKDNHIKAAGGIKNAVMLAREGVSHTIKIEVETETLEEVMEALDSRADIIMLDNMSLDMMREAVKIINGRAIVEASGNVSLETIYDIASTGVDIISVGGLTHSAIAFDISMKIS